MQDEQTQEVVKENESVENTGNETEEKTFTQAQVDKMIKDRLDKQAKKLQKDKSEAEKLENMNAEQKAKYQQDKREQDLAKREADIIKRELLATAKDILTERGLPVDLAGVIDLTDAETVEKSIDTIGKQWEKAVQKGVSERLKGTQPLSKAPQNSSGIDKKTLQKMTYQERLKYKLKNPDDYNKLMN